MNVAVIGLGLIGGSMAKAIQEQTDCTVYGTDLVPSVVLRAKLTGAIDEELTIERLHTCETVIIALYPADTVEWLRNHAADISKKALVVDCCGIKKFVCDQAQPIAEANGFTFVGGHPMAGIERSGFDHSQGAMFRNASMILTPSAGTDIRTLERAKGFFCSIGFADITLRTPEEHDRIIAYTSQLAHVLSNAYIKSPTAPYHSGLSAGSFRDMTRVATMNPTMWTELFLENRDHLITEIDALAERLLEYSTALKQNDADGLRRLLEDGVMMKALCDKNDERTRENGR